MDKKRGGSARFVPAVQLALGVLIVVAAILVLLGTLDLVARDRLPEGWEIIRPPDEVTCLLVREDRVWTGGANGLVVLNSTTLRPVPLPAVPRFGHVRALTEDPRGSVWIAHDHGLARFFRERWEECRDGSGQPFASSSSVMVDREGAVWVGTSQRLMVGDGSNWTVVEPPGGWQMESVDLLFQDRDGTLWMGSSSVRMGGLYSLNGSTWRHFTLADGLPHQTIRSVAQGRDGTLWIGAGYAAFGGLAEVHNGTWTSWSTADGLAGDNTRSVFEDSHGRLWIGSEYDGLVILDGKERHRYTDRDGLAGSEVKVVVEDSGVFWVGTSGGLSRIETGAI